MYTYRNLVSETCVFFFFSIGKLKLSDWFSTGVILPSPHCMDTWQCLEILWLLWLGQGLPLTSATHLIMHPPALHNKEPSGLNWRWRDGEVERCWSSASFIHSFILLLILLTFEYLLWTRYCPKHVIGEQDRKSPCTHVTYILSV